jgi:hypothetical protein
MKRFFRRINVGKFFLLGRCRAQSSLQTGRRKRVFSWTLEPVCCLFRISRASPDRLPIEPENRSRMLSVSIWRVYRFSYPSEMTERFSPK